MDEKQIEGVISTTLKQAPFKKGVVQTTAQVNFVCFCVLIILNAKIERYVRPEKLVLEQLNREPDTVQMTKNKTTSIGINKLVQDFSYKSRDVTKPTK